MPRPACGQRRQAIANGAQALGSGVMLRTTLTHLHAQGTMHAEDINRLVRNSVHSTQLCHMMAHVGGKQQGGTASSCKILVVSTGARLLCVQTARTPCTP